MGVDQAVLDPPVPTAGPGERRAAARLRRTAPVVGTFLVLFVVFFASPTAAQSDPFWVPYTARSLVDDHDLDLRDDGVAVGDDYALVAEDDQVVSFFPWATAAMTAPLVLLDRAVEPTGWVVPLDDQLGSRDTDQFQRLSASLFAAAAATVLALVARRLLRSAWAAAGAVDDGSRRVGVERWWWVPASGLALGLGSSLWSTASRGLWQHGPGTLVLGLAWWSALGVSEDADRPSDARWALLSGALGGLACGVRPTNAVFVVGLGAFLAWRRRPVLMRWVTGRSPSR